MRPGSIALSIVLISALFAGTVSAQEASSGAPMPYDEYRSAIEAVLASDDEDGSDGLPTAAEVMASFDEGQQGTEAELERLVAITPEDCYAVAHEEMQAYLDTSLKVRTDGRALLADSETLIGMLPVFALIQAEIRASHPFAYIEDENELDGFRNDRLAILDELATCASEKDASSPESTTAAVFEAVDDEERLRLEALCNENTVTETDLGTCLDVVRMFLAPGQQVPQLGAQPAADDVIVKGKGESSTEAFELAGGDYLVTFTAVSPKKADDGCFSTGSLRTAEDNDEVGELWASAPKRKSATVKTYMYALDPGRYYANVDISSCRQWEVKVQSTEIDYGEPTPGVIVRDGVTSFSTEAFALAGGDYLARFELSATSEDCDFQADLRAVDDEWRTVGEVSGEAGRRSTDSGETRFFAVDAGQYYWDVDSDAYDGVKCRWSITLEAS